MHIDLDAGEVHGRAELELRLHEIIDDHVRRLGLTLHHQSLSGRFGELIRAASTQAGQRAVVLVDEYDKPILDNLTDRETAAVMRVR